MSLNKFDPQEWGHRLDAGEQNDPTLLLAAQLEKDKPGRRPLPLRVKTDLRHRLVTQAAAVPTRRLDYWVASLALTALLIILAALIWSLRSENPPTAAATQDTELIAAVPTGPAIPHEAEPGEESWKLDQIRQSVDGNKLMIQTTLAYTLTAPATATFSLGTASSSSIAEPPEEILGTFVLGPEPVSAIGNELDVQFTVDPWDVWQQFNSYDLILAVRLERETADGPVVINLSDQPFTLRAEWLDQIWFIRATPEPGTPLDNTKFVVVLGYRLLSAPMADVQLLIAAPGWENSMGSGRLPTKGVSDPRPVSRGEGVLTFIFTTEDAAYLHTLLGDEATLAVTMLSPGEDGTVRALIQQTFSQYRWPIVGADQPPDRLWFISVSPESGATIREGDTIIVTVGYELYAAVEGSVHLALRNAEWNGVSPPINSLGGQSITPGTGQVEFQFVVDDLSTLQARVGQFARLEAQLYGMDAQNQTQQRVEVTLDEMPWRLGDVMLGIPRLIPQVTIVPEDGAVSAGTRLDVLDIQASADSAAGMMPITFTVRLAYQLATRDAEEGTIMIWVAAAPDGTILPLVLVAETVRAGAGILEATFTFNPQRDLDEMLRQPRRYQLMFSFNKVDDPASLFWITLPPDWEFRP